MKNKYIRNALIFTLVVGSLLMADLTLKSYNFILPDSGTDSNGYIQQENFFIGIRSYAHTNSSFFSFINMDISNVTQMVISYLTAGGLIIWMIFANSKLNVIALAIMISGVLGNAFDTTFFGYVRDIFYTPWADRGTFNFADVLTVFGAILLFIWILIETFKK